MIELRTARLRLRPFREEDGPAHLALYRDPEVTRPLRDGPFLGEQAEIRSRRVVDMFVRHWTDTGYGVFAVEERATGRFLGQCGLKIVAELAEVELLYAFERAAWGRGLATEAGGAALAYGFETVALARIIGITHPDNRASRRVLEKLGMRDEGDREVFGLRAALYGLAREEFARRG